MRSCDAAMCNVYTQAYEWFDEPKVVLPGDSLSTYCIYDTSQVRARNAEIVSLALRSALCMIHIAH